eukprot:132239-Prymnesium_polylepis.2
MTGVLAIHGLGPARFGLKLWHQTWARYYNRSVHCGETQRRGNNIAVVVVAEAPSHTMAMVLLECPDVRVALMRLVAGADEVTLKRWHSSITKTHKHRSCSVQNRPKVNWKPRSVEEGLEITKLLYERRGLHTAPEGAEEEEFCHKIVLNDVQQTLLHKAGFTKGDKGTKLSTAVAVKSFSCRVVEEAQWLNANSVDGATMGKLEMHGTHDAPSWAPSCRGAGIIYTKEADGLLDAAIDRVRARFA